MENDMNKPTFVLADIGKTLTNLFATYTEATSSARTALIDAATLVFTIDNNATAFIDNDGKALVGKKLTNARGSWFMSIGLEPFFTNLARSHGNAVDLMGAAWTHAQSVETIKRLAPDLSKKHKVKGRQKLMPKADRRKAVKATLIAAQKIADNRGDNEVYTGADIQATRNTRDDAQSTPVTIADLMAFATTVDTNYTGNMTREEWDTFVVFIDNVTLYVADMFTTQEAKAKADAEATAEADAEADTEATG